MRAAPLVPRQLLEGRLGVLKKVHRGFVWISDDFVFWREFSGRTESCPENWQLEGSVVRVDSDAEPGSAACECDYPASCVAKFCCRDFSTTLPCCDHHDERRWRDPGRFQCKAFVTPVFHESTVLSKVSNRFECPGSGKAAGSQFSLSDLPSRSTWDSNSQWCNEHPADEMGPDLVDSGTCGREGQCSQ